MNYNEYIYSAIYRGALKEGAHEHSAKNAAVIGLSEYKKNRFKNIKTLIDTMIKNAKKRNF